MPRRVSWSNGTYATTGACVQKRQLGLCAFFRFCKCICIVFASIYIFMYACVYMVPTDDSSDYMCVRYTSCLCANNLTIFTLFDPFVFEHTTVIFP